MSSSAKRAGGKGRQAGSVADGMAVRRWAKASIINPRPAPRCGCPDAGWSVPFELPRNGRSRARPLYEFQRRISYRTAWGRARSEKVCAMRSSALMTPAQVRPATAPAQPRRRARPGSNHCTPAAPDRLPPLAATCRFHGGEFSVGFVHVIENGASRLLAKPGHDGQQLGVVNVKDVGLRGHGAQERRAPQGPRSLRRGRGATQESVRRRRPHRVE